MDDRDNDASNGERSGLSRRAFLGLGGAGTATTYVALSVGPGGKALAQIIKPPPPDRPKKTYTTVVRRAVDQLVLTLDFWNLKPDFTKTPIVLTQVDPNAVANYISVRFPGQNIAEEVFLKAGSPSTPQPDPGHPPGGVPLHPSAPPVSQRLAGTSRLVFVIPSGDVAPSSSDPLPFSLNTLLDWMFYDLSVVPNAQPAIPPSETALAIGKPVQPSATQTAIELPFRLLLSPYSTDTHKEGFVNAIQPVQHEGRTELWHTRLSVKKPEVLFYVFDETDRKNRTVRAVWATDPSFKKDLKHSAPSTPDDVDFRGPLEYQDRYDIVRLSSDFSLTLRGLLSPDPVFVPTPATVDRLMLSSLGGWLESDAHWDLPHVQKGYNSSLLQWRHRAAQGRDNYVRVVRKGFLFPYGHRASLVTISEREFSHIDDNNSKDVGAYLRQRVFIIVTQPVKDYFTDDDQDPYVPHKNRKLPFTTLELITKVTPDLYKETAYIPAYAGGLDEKAFEPMLDPTDPFLFHFRGTDWAGTLIDFRSPVVWVDFTEAFGVSDANPGHMDEIITAWEGQQNSVDLHSQRVNVAPPTDPDVPGDTQVVAQSFVIGAEPPISSATFLDLQSADQPRFYPVLDTITLKMPEVATASGNNVSPPTLEYEPGAYLPGGFPATAGGVFLSLPASDPSPKGVNFSSDKAGGSVTPNLNINGLSRHLGPVSGDIGELSNGTFNPANVFADVDAKMLGGITLQDILKQVDFGDASSNSDDPNAQALSVTSVELQHPHRIVTTFDWHPVIQTSSSEIPGVGSIFEVLAPDPPDTDPKSSDDSFDLHGVIVTYPEDASKSTSTIVGQIRDFAINLFGNDDTFFMQIPFNSLTFRAEKGKKTDVDVDVGDVAFEGALSFVQDLASLLSFDGSGLTVTTEGSAIQVLLTLAVPSIGVGVFSLSNLAISVGCAIPYDGSPVRFTFDFCSRENPFQLMVMMFGGGGFVGLQIGIDGVELLEFSFEFGAGISIDIGIASGSIELMGGVYFSVTTEHMPPNGDIEELDFTAYIKASGGISALGIVSISVELYLALTYEGPNPQLLAGDATLTVSVHVLFFGGSISISVHKEFENSTPQATPQVRGASHHALARPLDDPFDNSFGGVMTADDWVQYCQSIAEVGV